MIEFPAKDMSADEVMLPPARTMKASTEPPEERTVVSTMLLELTARRSTAMVLAVSKMYMLTWLLESTIIPVPPPMLLLVIEMTVVGDVIAFSKYTMTARATTPPAKSLNCIPS